MPANDPQPAYFALQIALTKASGGIETAMVHYHRMFAASGVPVLSLYRGPDGALLEAEGLELLPPPRILTALEGVFATAARGLRRTVRERAKGRRLVIVVHSDLALRGLRRLFPEAVTVAACHSDKFDRKRQADLVITLNADQQARAEAALAGGRATVVQLGNPYVHEADRAPARSGATPRVVFCARFTETKDPGIVVEAHRRLSALSPQGAPPELVMIGAGPLDAEIRASAGDGVRFAGWLPDPWAEIRPSDILVHPSHWEGLPFQLIEALDRGVPVIASDIAGNRAALADGAAGDLFPVGDADALARLLAARLADPAPLRAKAEAGRAMLRERYGAEAFWRNLRTAIEGLG